MFYNSCRCWFSVPLFWTRKFTSCYTIIHPDSLSACLTSVFVLLRLWTQHCSQSLGFPVNSHCKAGTSSSSIYLFINSLSWHTSLFSSTIYLSYPKTFKAFPFLPKKQVTDLISLPSKSSCILFWHRFSKEGSDNNKFVFHLCSFWALIQQVWIYTTFTSNAIVPP